MTTRIIRKQTDVDGLVTLLRSRKLPYTITIVQGAHRTSDQNKLQRKWLGEAAEQLGDRTVEELRAYCKLTFGVPILRRDNEAFRAQYDRLIKGRYTYEEKLAFMMEPVDNPVTRIMSSKQKTEYLDAIYRHFASQGIVLTIPRRGDEDDGDVHPKARR